MNEIERMQRLIRLAVSWLRCDDNTVAQFIPNNEELEKVARTRTTACARQLLQELGSTKATGWTVEGPNE